MNTECDQQVTVVVDC